MKATVLTKETILDNQVTDRKFPKFRVGDTIEVGALIKEGNKERIQIFKGDVISMHRKGIATTFTVRKLSADGVFVERIFPYYSPLISTIAIIKEGDVRRARLYYLRDKVGRGARIKEMVLTKEQKEKRAAQASN
ncbi:MAG: 50S ribosomal protein L19 [candidate division TM6 bacterium GW2011_GWF2_28_16]|jgi:large subunit ribosomal protein L19|nr:MAG: 50S ribosomal protein L19 [candidate division TM6 bacterium GW2011_GWF2_28_16]